MAVNFRQHKVTQPNEHFKVTNLKKLNFEIFEKACIACMTEEPEYRAMFDIPTSEEYVLYKGKGTSEAVIRVRNWSGYLSVHCQSKNGVWIINSHVGGETQEDIIKEAWREVSRVKSLVNKDLVKVKEWK